MLSHDGGMAVELEILKLATPQEERRFPLGRFEVFRLGGTSVGRAVYQPGWRWSKHVAPTAGTDWCEVEHVGLVLSGRAAVEMRDGAELEMGPGELFSIPAGHDSWVIGDEEYVSLHLPGAQGYATPAATGRPERGDPAPGEAVSTENAPRSSWGEGCDAWTLLSTRRLHVVEEQMPPGAAEKRHRHTSTDQLYYVLDGRAAVEIDGAEVSLEPRRAIRIPAGAGHRIRNGDDVNLRLLVASSGPPRDDREDLP